MSEVILNVKDLKTYFDTEEGMVKAVDGLSYQLHKNETLGIVGESGCGKSVSSLSLLRLIDFPGKILPESEIVYSGVNLVGLSERKMEKIRGNEISMIFQEPMTSLNPVITCGKQMYQVLRVHQKMNKEEARSHSIEMLSLVGISTPEHVIDQYPHELSGGMRQRIMIAMALACEPKILIADEPTTALDVTIQAQILRLFEELQQKLNMGIIFITHDMGVVAEIADTVLVMYAGQAVEKGSVYEIFAEPKHPYTQGLLKAIPSLTKTVDKLNVIEGTVPSASDFPPGCRFAPRCEFCMDICTKQNPELINVSASHETRCHLYSRGN